MKANDENRIKQLLQQALPPVDIRAEPGRDLWPDVLRRIDAQPAPLPQFSRSWLDWAILAGLVALAASFPASIPVFLYYL
jgi:hypothetical protein